MAEFNLNFDALWEGVTAALNNVVKTRISIPKGRSYFSIASETHKGLITYQTEYRVRDSKAQVAIETFGGEEAKAAIEAIIAKAPEGHIIKTVEVKQGAKNKDKWAWPIQAPVADFNVYNGELVAWYVNTITALYTFFENESSVASQANVAQPSRKNCVRVEVEIVEHDYAAFDSEDEMLDSSFTFNSDESPNAVRIFVDDIPVEFDEDELNVEDNLALIAVVGRGMVKARGTAARVFAAVSDAGVNIKMIDQGSSELNIIIGIEEHDFNTAIEAIYNEFVK